MQHITPATSSGICKAETYADELGLKECKQCPRRQTQHLTGQRICRYRAMQNNLAQALVSWSEGWGREVYGDIKDWDMSRIVNLRMALSKISSDNADVSKWDVGRVTSLQNLFGQYNPPKFAEGDFSKWDVSNVKDFGGVFRGARFKSDLSKWDVGRATSMSNMFLECSSFVSDLSKWNVARVQDVSEMFVEPTYGYHSMGGYPALAPP